jgi:hypothetical protein
VEAKQPHELTAEQKAELRTGRVIRSLVQSEGWRVYQKILELHLQGKRNEWEEPAVREADGIAQVLRAESAKGAIMGLRLALSIPEGILSNDRILRQQVGLAGDDDE